MRLIQNGSGPGGVLSENQRNVREGLAYVLGLTIENNLIHLEATDPEALLMPLLLSLSASGVGGVGGSEGTAQRNTCSWILSHAVKFMTTA